MASGSIEHLNSTIALERLVVGRGIELVARGDELRGACVWCGGAEALVVRPGDNTWACEPCGRGGGVVDWVAAVEGVSQKHAVELLREDVLGEEVGVAVVKKSTVPKLQGVVDDAGDSHAIVRSVIDYYHETLKQSPEALGYLQKRGITDPEALAQFQIGFCNRTLGFRIPAKNRKAGKAIRDVLTEGEMT